MKVSFKKLTLLTFHSDRHRITQMLQELGVIHLELDTEKTDRSVEELSQEKNRLISVIDTIQSYSSGRKVPMQHLRIADSKVSAEEVVRKVMQSSGQLENHEQQLELLRKDQLKLKPWGDFDIEKVRQLAEHNIRVHFCIANKKLFKANRPEHLTYEIIREGTDRIYFVVISKGEVPEIPYETMDLPEMGISEIKAKISKIRELNKEIIAKIWAYDAYVPLLKCELRKVENKLSFAHAFDSYHVHSEGAIHSIKGWFPAGMEDRMVQFLEKEKVVYTIENPTSGDQVPVLLKNQKYSALFESITRIFELPDYYELDPTPFIAVFYPILFAYCLGDAGYGAVLTVGALAGWFTFLKHTKKMALLGIILGVFTTVLGIVKSGSIFGLPLSGVGSVPLFQFLAQYVIIPDDRNYIFNAFNVALMIGVVQILIGILISIYNKISYEGFLCSLSQIGKLLIVASLIWIFLADMQGVEELQPLRLLRRTLLFGGVGLVVFFHDLSQSILMRPASALLPLFFIATGILGDILSYVRLFALGVASSVLGLVVNQIGMQIISNGWWGVMLGIIFLLFGHSLNFGIALLGAFVHPLRLTFVEFYNNAQFRGGGISYEPFRKIELTDK